MIRKKSLIVLFLCVPFAIAAEKAPQTTPQMPPYRVEARGFNDSARDIKALCDSAGRELWKHFPDYKIEKFVIKRGRGGPISLFKRNNQGEIVIRLDTGNQLWCQYSYQFTHEFCHVLAGYEEDDPGNKWFEETLAETASLYALRAMAKSWKTDPPYGHWKNYRDALRDYSDKTIRKWSGIYEIYAKGLPGFYKAHQAELAKEPCNRELNGAMALVFLRLFEEDPSRWGAIRWLNKAPSPKGETFEQFLTKWHKAVPEKHKPFVKKVADLFGVPLEISK